MRPGDLRFELTSITCSCGLGLIACERHRLPFFASLKEKLPEENQGVINPELFTRFVDPVKAAEFALKATGIAMVFAIVWQILADGYKLGFTVSREAEAAEAAPAESSS